MSTFMDLLRGMFVRIGGTAAATRRVNTIDLVPGTGLGISSDFNEHTGLLTVTVAAEGSALDEQVSATDRLLGRDTAGAGAVEELTVSGGVEFTGSGGIRRSALTGDVTAAAGSNTTAIAAGAIDLVHLSTEVTDAIEGGSGPTGSAGGDLTGTYPNPTVTTGVITLAKMANISSDRLLGRDTPSAGQPEELTLDGGIEFTGGGGVRRSALTGDVTCSAGSNTTAIASNAVTTTKIADNQVTFAKVQQIATDRLIGRDTAGSGNAEEIALGASLEFTGSGTIQRAALTGDVTASANSNATTIASNAVTDAKLRDSTACSVIGRSANSSGDPADIAAGADNRVLCRTGNVLSFAQVTGAMIATNTVALANIAQVTTDRLLGRDTAGTGNLEELSVGASLEFSGSGSIQRAALTGDVTASANSNATTIAAGAVTTAKIADANVTDAKLATMPDATIKGRPKGAGTGAPQNLDGGNLITILNPTLVHTYEYDGGGTESWEKDDFAVDVDFLYVGGGGGGGGLNAGVGGGGGGPGAIMRISYPAYAVPRELNVLIGNAGTAGNTGSNTVIYDESANFSLTAPGGGPGVAGGAGGVAGNYGLNSAVTGGAGGAATGLDGGSGGLGGKGGTGGTGAPGSGGYGYGAGGGGAGDEGLDGGGGGAGGYGFFGSTIRANGGAFTAGGTGMSGFARIVTHRGGWAPVSLGANLVLSLDTAKQFVVDTGGVSQWIDQSAYGYDAEQSSSSIRPTDEETGWNGIYPSILFNGETSGDFMIADAVAPEFAGDDTPWTIHWVGQIVGNPTGLRVVLCVGATANDFALIRFAVNASDQWEVFTRDDANTGSRAITGGAYDTSRHQHTLRFNGTTLEYWVDGVSQGTNSTAQGTATLTRFTIGGMRRSSGGIENPINVRMVGALAVDRALADDELSLLWTWSRNWFGGLT